jgi:hypothetical protein
VFDGVHKICEKLSAQGKKPAAFICESMLGCGGHVPLPEGFLQQSYQYVRQHGGLCIADEIQVGFGRAGKHFWSFELQDVVPDIVTLGKPIGNGHPLGAVITMRKIAEEFANGMEYFNTFGGNHVSCSVGMAVLDVMEQEGLRQNALETGSWLKDNLEALKNSFPLIGDVSGAGSLVSGSRTNSTPRKNPSPRTSPIKGKEFFSASRLSFSQLPVSRAFCRSPSCSITSRTAIPTEQETWFPPKVLKYSMPLANSSAIFRVVITAPKGCPLPIGLPRVTMSGTTSCSSNDQKCFPARPKPT